MDNHTQLFAFVSVWVIHARILKKPAIVDSIDMTPDTSTKVMGCMFGISAFIVINTRVIINRPKNPPITAPNNSLAFITLFIILFSVYKLFRDVWFYIPPANKKSANIAT